MNKLFQIFIVLMSVSFLTFYSCSKDKDTASSQTYWEVDGDLFQSDRNAGVLFKTDSGGTVLVAQTKTKDVILLGFKGDLEEGEYKLFNLLQDLDIQDLSGLNGEELGEMTALNEDECVVFVKDVKNEMVYFSATENAGTVSITKNGKRFTAEFKDITLAKITADLDLIKVKASGKIVQR